VLDKRCFGDTALPFYRFLKSAGYDVVLAEGSEKYAGNNDPVDEFILDQLFAVSGAANDNHPVSVGLISHDHIYAPPLEQILSAHGRVAVIGFREWLAPQLLALAQYGAEIIDLEAQMGAFNKPLTRERPFSPLDLL